ncbi:MAG: hypothetical protein R3B40_24830 [Polyangiales bacterium]|nr:hypothetical protein [Myxococcales bacterium]MCB9662206.1 hypothetical protein [Sandaracinaceae bacterium]
MPASLPDPIVVPWTMKTLDSAVTTLDFDERGRMRASIVHDVLHGVTPEMLVWWFQNLRGTVEIEGHTHPRYRVWHPRDHVEHRYLRTPAAGDGVGSVFLIHEVLGRDPRYRVCVRTDVVRLDEGGFAHRPRFHGISGLVAMDYSWRRVPGGTRYENAITVGPALPRGLSIVQRAIRSLAFDEAHARAWLLHNVEEVGNLEHFLPALFHTES